MKTKEFWGLILLLAILAGLAGGAPAWAESVVTPVAGPQNRLSSEEQQALATKLFYGFYEQSRNQDGDIDRLQLLAMYNRIIAECPDVPLAQESYWRLIELALDGDEPARKDKALALYREFMRKYPQSPLTRVIDEILSRFLYHEGHWLDLAAVVGRTAMGESQPQKSLLMAFYLAEARFHLGEQQTALAIYESLVKESPNSRMATIAKDRINRIKGTQQPD